MSVRSDINDKDEKKKRKKSPCQKKKDQYSRDFLVRIHPRFTIQSIKLPCPGEGGGMPPAHARVWVLSTANHDPGPFFPQHARLHRFRTPLPALFPRQEPQHPIRFPLGAPRSFPPVAMPITDPRFFLVRPFPRRPIVVSDDLQPTAPRRTGTPWRLPPLRRWSGMGTRSWDSRRWGHFVRGIVFRVV